MATTAHCRKAFRLFFTLSLLLVSGAFNHARLGAAPYTAPPFLFKFGAQAPAGQFNFPQGVAVDGSGNVYVVDEDNCRVQKFSADGSFLRAWGSRGDGDGQFWEPKSVAVDGSGNVYVTDTAHYRVQKFDSNGAFLAKWGEKGSGDGQFIAPDGITTGPGSAVYVADKKKRYPGREIYSVLFW